MKKKLLITVVSSMLALGVSAQAAAATVYNYVGNYFDVFWDSPEIPHTYASTMRVEGSITTAIPLEPDRPYSNINDLVVSYAFSDGVQAISSAQPEAISSFFLSTDPSGNISNWDISVVLDYPTTLPLENLMGTIDTSNYDLMGMGMYQNDTGLVYGVGDAGRTWYDWGYTNGASGEWTKGSIPSVPLPPAVLLFGSALAFIFFAPRRKLA